MNVPVLGICLLNLLALALLPRLFFRAGRMPLAWWLTTLPFLFLAAVLLAGAAGLVQPVQVGPAVEILLAGMGALLATLAAALMGMTVGAHRVPPALWHQADDAPAHIVTWGPYAVVRHPFYVSYILNMAAAVCVLPHWTTVLALGAGTARLAQTARREEQRLLASAFGAEYREYMRRTGRFLPSQKSTTSTSRPSSTASTSGGIST